MIYEKYQYFLHKVWIVADEDVDEKLDLLQVKIADSCALAVEDNRDLLAILLLFEPLQNINEHFLHNIHLFSVLIVLSYTEN